MGVAWSTWPMTGSHMYVVYSIICVWGGIQGRNMLFYWSRKPGFLTPVFMLDTISGRTVKLSNSTTTPTCVLSPRRGLSVETLLQSAGMAHRHVTLQSEHEEHLRLRPRLPFINRWPLSDKLCNSVTREVTPWSRLYHCADCISYYRLTPLLGCGAAVPPPGTMVIWHGYRNTKWREEEEGRRRRGESWWRCWNANSSCDYY